MNHLFAANHQSFGTVNHLAAIANRFTATPSHSIGEPCHLFATSSRLAAASYGLSAGAYHLFETVSPSTGKGHQSSATLRDGFAAPSQPFGTAFHSFAIHSGSIAEASHPSAAPSRLSGTRHRCVASSLRCFVIPVRTSGTTSGPFGEASRQAGTSEGLSGARSRSSSISPLQFGTIFQPPGRSSRMSRSRDSRLPDGLLSEGQCFKELTVVRSFIQTSLQGVGSGSAHISRDWSARRARTMYFLISGFWTPIRPLSFGKKVDRKKHVEIKTLGRSPPASPKSRTKQTTQKRCEIKVPR